jgi:hypothetical protein
VRPSLDFRRRFRIEHCHQTLYTFYVIRRFWRAKVLRQTEQSQVPRVHLWPGTERCV